MLKSFKEILKLVGVAFKRMPFLVLVWLTLPVIIGFTVLPSAKAQINLIDLAAESLKGLNLNETIELVTGPVLILTFSALTKAIAQSVKNILDKVLAEKYMFNIQSDIIECTMSVPMELFEDAEFHNRLSRAKVACKENLLNIFTQLSYLVQMILNFIFAILVLSRGHWLIPVFAVVVSLATMAQRLWIEIKVKSLDKDLTFEGRMADELKMSLAKHNILKELRVFGSINYVMNKWVELESKQINARGDMRRNEIKTGAIFVFMRPASLVVSVLLLILGLQQGNVTPGTVAVVFQKIIEVQMIGMFIAFPLSRIYILGTKALYIVEFLKNCKEYRKNNEKTGNLPSSVKAEVTRNLKTSDQAGKSIDQAEVSDTAELPVSDKTVVRLDNISFSYPGADKLVLNNVSLSINQGETIALVGENGSGKSTLVNLLLGLYSPTEGKLYWGDRDYSTIEQEELNKNMSAVFQDFMCYEFTVRENIGIGNPDKIQDDESIKEAIGECGILEITEEKEGLDTPLGRLQECGRELSGGQWQRLAIARAMYKDAGMIIFDEPTAAIDPNAELELFKNFRRLTGGKSSVFVSHRLGWARFADRILVMDKGRLVEQGTHDYLMKKKGFYARSFNAQASWYVD